MGGIGVDERGTGGAAWAQVHLPDPAGGPGGGVAVVRGEADVATHPADFPDHPWMGCSAAIASQHVEPRFSGPGPPFPSISGQVSPGADHDDAGPFLRSWVGVVMTGTALPSPRGERPAKLQGESVSPSEP